MGRGGNITFQVGDSHHLEFPDNTFDVVYSHAVTHFFLDPVAALKEQKRVAKKGGWVIASGVRDIASRYPACPNWDKVWGAWVLFHESLLKRFQSSGDDPAKHLEQHSEAGPGSKAPWPASLWSPILPLSQAILQARTALA